MDFFQTYLNYIGKSEAPAVYHRWSLMTAIGAMLGRRLWLEHGSFKIYPNMYVMLLGSSGVRKSTSIKIVKKLVKAAGYDTIAADRTSKEKFLMDLAGETNEHDGPSKSRDMEQLLDADLFSGVTGGDRELFVMADEANDFFGTNNMEFLSVLGSLWDYEGDYLCRYKTGKSFTISNPTVSILSANTPTNFAAAFPPEILGQGFFSRILLIHGESNGIRIPFPTSPSSADTEQIVGHLQSISNHVGGACSLSRDAEVALSDIYMVGYRVDDIRFESYSNRRFTHLLKLALIAAAARRDTVISYSDVVYANTVLSYAEYAMPKALGEFGKAKNSAVADKVLRVIAGHPSICTVKEIWQHVSSDLEELAKLSPILQGLAQADKIQAVHSGDAHGYIPKKKELGMGISKYINLDLLTEEERNMRI